MEPRNGIEPIYYLKLGNQRYFLEKKANSKLPFNYNADVSMLKTAT